MTTQEDKPKPKGRMSEENIKVQRKKASVCIVVEFNDGNVRRFWSDEAKRPHKIKTINDALKTFWDLFRGKWFNSFKKVGVFDVRVNEKPGYYNKIYQFEDGKWSKLMDY